MIAKEVRTSEEAVDRDCAAHGAAWGRRLGSLAGAGQVPDDFDLPLPGVVLDEFESNGRS